MCDEQDLARWAKAKLTRRAFGGGAMAAGVAACAPVGVEAEATETSGGLTERTVGFDAPGGTMDGFFVHPAGTRSPLVLFWPDIGGIREAKRQMARRLAGDGYAVFVANPYYRDVAGQQFEDFADFASSGGWEKASRWRRKLDAEAIQADTRAATAWLDTQPGVDRARGIGTQGYCMGGPFTVWSVAAVPRMKAAASFHGGGLVRDSDTSPHRMLREDAHYLIAIARDDDAKEPEAKTEFREAANSNGAEAEIEVYDADHGWCVPDAPACDQAEADRAWARLLATYAKAL
ncbi:MAG: dienelactone hydrolase family protein [Erythrobacter sp.]|uniref:dienelactone hydrolase family protein n=1 Tax=Erythrobacter sp. TaxID=1042 RepID=UPI001B17A108|nr:dienelactone hydrolase family protein [Erythrobacter sp.]MBO6767445.1 dienelactone hydrolase family protein [Erythrobacter sp.]